MFPIRVCNIRRSDTVDQTVVALNRPTTAVIPTHNDTTYSPQHFIYSNWTEYSPLDALNKIGADLAQRGLLYDNMAREDGMCTV